MSKMYRSSRGKSIDMDLIRLKNEEEIAIGNAGLNARGDKLGKGGKVVKTRNELMRDYHKMNTPVAQSEPVQKKSVAVAEADEKIPTEPKLVTPIPTDEPVAATVESKPKTKKKTNKKARGSLASTVSKSKVEE